MIKKTKKFWGLVATIIGNKIHWKSTINPDRCRRHIPDQQAKQQIKVQIDRCSLVLIFITNIRNLIQNVQKQWKQNNWFQYLSCIESCVFVDRNTRIFCSVVVYWVVSNFSNDSQLIYHYHSPWFFLDFFFFLLVLLFFDNFAMPGCKCWHQYYKWGLI